MSSSENKKDAQLLDCISHDEEFLVHTVPVLSQDGMGVPIRLYLNDSLYKLFSEEVCSSHSEGFPSSISQLVNTSRLPGIIGNVIGLPDIHSGYGFCIGTVAAFDCSNPCSIISPGGIGYDINCGVSFIRTNIHIDYFAEHQENIAQKIYENVSVGIASGSTIAIGKDDFKDIITNGVSWSVRKGYLDPEDVRFYEGGGYIEDGGDLRYLSQRSQQRGINQFGSLGSGNHYIEVQCVEEVYDVDSARIMGIMSTGQICIMIHCGSRGFGHQVASDYVSKMRASLRKKDIHLDDEQLAYSEINSDEGKSYFNAMISCCHYAFCNRSVIFHQIKKSFESIFDKSSKELGIRLVSDVSHNIAKIEEHVIDGEEKQLLVHRKGSSTAFPPGHDKLPLEYKSIGQPIPVGGSMGTCSYIITGTEKGSLETFGSACHGAGRALSRVTCKREIDKNQVISSLKSKHISFRVSNSNNLSEEAPESYKDVNLVVDTCVKTGIARKILKLRPVCVIRG